MSNLIEIKNAKVSYSTMKNKDTKKIFGRVFKVLVPINSPELEETIRQYKKLDERAREFYGQKTEQKVKKAKSVDDVFQESIYEEGFVELPFNVYFMREEVVKDEDGKPVLDEKGKEKTVKTEELNPIYDNPNFTYVIDNNGNKVYQCTETSYWAPLSGNMVNIKYSLVSKYSKKNNQPVIQLKAEDVQLLNTEFSGKSLGAKTGFLTLSDEDDEIEEKVEKAPVKKATKAKTTEDGTKFSAEELASLDI